MFWGTFDADTSAGTATGTLVNCPDDGAYDTATGLCSTKDHFTNTFSNEGAKVLVSATSLAGHYVAGTADSASLMKACVTNANTAPTDS